MENGKIVESPSASHPHAPYRQSQRKEIYKEYALQLIASGDAYYSFESAQELEELRSRAEANNETFTYNHTVRVGLNNSLSISAQECERRIATTNNWVIRYKMEPGIIIEMEDKIRGKIEVNSSTLDDKVLWKAADQLPTYHLANVVDDKLMEITDVIRGEEWLPSLPLHYMLYRSLGWENLRPSFSHLSLLLKPDGKGKLSKRDGDRLGFPVFPLEWVGKEGERSSGYREEGYYPEAFINMLAFLGWNPGNEKEIFSLEQLVKEFTLERVIKSGAKFNVEKARWYNQEYLRKRDTNLLIDEWIPILKSKGVERDREYIAKALEMIKERISFISEAWPLSSYLFIAPAQYDPNVKSKFWKEESHSIMLELATELEKREFSKEELESVIPNFIKERGLPMGGIMNLLRLLLVGESKGPGVADIMALIGKEESLNRIKKRI